MSLDEIASLLADARPLRNGVARAEPDPSSVAHHDLEQLRKALDTDLQIRRVIHSAELWLIIATDQLFGLSLMVCWTQSDLLLPSATRWLDG
jgi:hypothetical protein